MRIVFHCIVLAASVLLFQAAVVHAQGRRAAEHDFQNRSPRVGDPVPNLTAYDAQGKPFPLSKLKGSYTVLVFGCLT